MRNVKNARILASEGGRQDARSIKPRVKSSGHQSLRGKNSNRSAGGWCGCRDLPAIAQATAEGLRKVAETIQVPGGQGGDFNCGSPNGDITKFGDWPDQQHAHSAGQCSLTSDR